MAEYDYIIVGAGSAGCVLANRLSENPANKVLLLEAGGRDWNPIIHIPLLAGVAYFAKSINWGYDTEPEPHLKNRQLHWPRGKVIGGSSSINGMMYIRGQPQDYETWRQMGNEGWDYASVLPYFKRAEGHVEKKDSPFHGTDGPWKIKRAYSDNPLYHAFFDACRAVGYNETDDFNGRKQEGFQWHDFNIVRGRRQSTAVAFLRPAMKRLNLHVETNAQATRVLLEGKRAVGIEYDWHGTRKQVRANREVILSGGAINSPALLQLSGIGEASALRGLGIDVVHDLPGVGKNLQDHMGVYVMHDCLQPVTMYKWFRPDRAALMMLQVMLFGTGTAAALPLEVGLFARSSPDVETPDLQISLVPGLSLETTMKGQGKHGFLIHCYQLRPESRGTIELRSANPMDKPLMKPNYLSAQKDVEVTREGVKIVRNLFAQDVFKPYLGKPISPDESVRTDVDIEDWIRASSETVFHPTSSCKMGVDPLAVVDPQLRVHGIQGLRVADASIMPTIDSGNTQAPTVMIAEKAADMILGRNPLPKEDPFAA
jgi:choline dehydrogenase